jgi:glycosyltransferase involved in cell wall biosynthesis
MSRDIEILIITPECPYPPNDGHKLRNYHLLRNIRKGIQFDLLTNGSEEVLNNDEIMKGLGKCFRSITMVPVKQLRTLTLKTKYDKIKNIFSPHELSLDSPFYSEDMCKAVTSKLSINKYDLVCYCGYSTYLYNKLPADKTPCVVDIVDSMSLYLKNDMKMQRNIRDKLRSYVNYMWARNYERKHFSKAKYIIMISQADADHVRMNCPKSKVWVVPNGVDTKYYECKSNQSEYGNTLLFTGVMSYRPNNESMIYFINEILPIVRNQLKEVTLTIAGRDPMPELQKLAQNIDGIKLTGYVNDIRPYFEQSSVYIAPVISGAGLKNKILEAWAMSMPVVATPLSCEGIDAKDDHNVILAKSSKHFADSIVKLLSDAELRNKLAKNGRITAENTYSWNSKAVALERIFREILNCI